MIRVLALGVLLAVLAPQAFAQQAPAETARPADFTADPAALEAFQQKANLYSAMLLDGRQIVIEMIDQIGAINSKSVDPAAKTLPFDDAFGPLMKLRHQALTARVAAAESIQGAEVLPLYAAGNETAARAAQLVNSYPTALQDILAEGTGLIDKTLELGPAAQKGDPKAQLALAGAMFGGMRTAVAAENLQLELGATTYGPVHPQHALSESSVASNRAMMEFFGVMHSQAEGGNLNLVGAARRIRDFAEESRAAAESVPQLTDAMIENLQSVQRAQGRALPADQLRALDSYRSSAINEIAITDHLTNVAITLAEKGIAGGVEDDWSDIEKLIDRRFQLDEGRRRALSR